MSTRKIEPTEPHPDAEIYCWVGPPRQGRGHDGEFLALILSIDPDNEAVSVLDVGVEFTE